MHRSEIEFKVSGFERLTSAFEKADSLEHLYEGAIICLANLKKEQRFGIDGVIHVAKGFEGVIVVCFVNLLAKLFSNLRNEALTTKELQVVLVFLLSFDGFVGILFFRMHQFRGECGSG